MNEEVMRILKMVEEGKIDSEKGAQLIDALGNKEESIKIKKDTDKTLKIKVLSQDGDDVNVNLPLKFVKAVIKSTGKIPVNINGMDKMNIDTQAISDAIDAGLEGDIVNIKDEDGDIVRIFIE